MEGVNFWNTWDEIMAIFHRTYPCTMLGQNIVEMHKGD
jgi:hypothetical protein